MDPPAAYSFRTLDVATDREVVTDLFNRGADYVRLEYGRAPDAQTIDGFFTDMPPGQSPEDGVRTGLFHGDRLIATVNHSYGYPKPDDAYIGLLLADPGERGQGLGTRFVAHLFDQMREQGAKRALVAVLDANPAGRRFWERQGFRLEKTFPANPDDEYPHIRHRLTCRL